MLDYGSSTDNTGNAVCGIRQWPETDCTAGYLLFCYGTIPNRNSVCPDSHKKCLLKAESMIQAGLEHLASSDGRNDHSFAAAIVSDVMQRINAQIYEIAAYLGQSICVGGVIAFFCGTSYIVVPFGGGDACLWANPSNLTHIGDPVTNDYITTNPIGSRKLWIGKYWNGTLQSGTRLLLSSNPLRSTPELLDSIQKGSLPGSHNDTAALMLRQVLAKNGLSPVAVLDFHC